MIDQCCAEACKLLRRASNGEDLAKEKYEEKKQISLAPLCNRYLENGVGTKKASTAARDRGCIGRHIKPLLGKKKVRDVTRAHVKHFVQDIANGGRPQMRKPACMAEPL
ncbi:unnamed protein product [Ectocarpus sp. 12 AP-2014]